MYRLTLTTKKVGMLLPLFAFFFILGMGNLIAQPTPDASRALLKEKTKEFRKKNKFLHYGTGKYAEIIQSDTFEKSSQKKDVKAMLAEKKARINANTTKVEGRTVIQANYEKVKQARLAKQEKMQSKRKAIIDKRKAEGRKKGN